MLTTCLDTGFVRVNDKLAEYFRPLQEDEDKRMLWVALSCCIPIKSQVCPVWKVFKVDLQSRWCLCCRWHCSANEVRMPLAKVVPIMNGLIHSVSGDAPNPFMQVDLHVGYEQCAVFCSQNFPTQSPIQSGPTISDWWIVWGLVWKICHGASKGVNKTDLCKRPSTLSRLHGGKCLKQWTT